MKEFEIFAESLLGRQITDSLLVCLEEMYRLSPETEYVDLEELGIALAQILGPAGKKMVAKINMELTH